MQVMHAHSHPPPRYDRSCSTNASMVGMRAANHALRHLQKLCLSVIVENLRKNSMQVSDSI